MAVTKIHAVTATVDKAVAYICNPDKTDESIYISSYACAPETAAIDFKYTLDHCRENSPNKAYHLIQAFAPGEVSFKEENEFPGEAGAFFAASCRMLKVTRQGFYNYPADKDRPWKYQDLADAVRAIAAEDECSDTYGRIRMYQALLLKQPEGVRIPGERTVYRIMENLSWHPPGADISMDGLYLRDTGKIPAC